MPPYHPADGCETDAATGKFGGQVQALEGNKKLVCIGHVETRSIIADKKHRQACSIGLLADGDVGCSTPGGELPGIAKQVFHQYPYQARIPLGDQAGLNMNLDMPMGFAAAPVVEDLPAQDRQVNQFITQFDASHVRQREQVFYQPTHLGGTSLDACEVMLRFVVGITCNLFGQQLAEAVNRVERRAQVMGDRI